MAWTLSCSSPSEYLCTSKCTCAFVFAQAALETPSLAAAALVEATATPETVGQTAAEELTLIRAPGTKTGWKGVVHVGKRFRVQVYDREAKRAKVLQGLSFATAEQVKRWLWGAARDVDVLGARSQMDGPLVIMRSS